MIAVYGFAKRICRKGGVLKRANERECERVC